jgi:serine/threonine-protein kinase
VEVDDEAQPRAHERVGRTLCRKWRIDQLIGTGGMADVYAATHCNNGARAAIKVLRGELAVSASAVERFRREGYTANRVGHPDVVRVLDTDTDEHGAPFLVMELLQGETLAARWRRAGRLAVGEVLAVGDAVLDVLAAAHEQGIVHRDIKPGNLFRLSDGRVKVLDFGIARLPDATPSSHLTRSNASLGTPAFMAPEQARGRWDQVDARTDVWAVGATMFTLLTGSHVHDAGTANEMMIAAATQAAPPVASLRRSLPPDVAAIVDRALAFVPADRWPSAREMRSALRAVRSALAPWDEIRIDEGGASTGETTRPSRTMGDTAMDVSVSETRPDAAAETTMTVTPDDAMKKLAPPLGRVITRCLAKDPAGRCANAGALLADLERAPPERHPRRRWLAIALAGAAAAAGTIARWQLGDHTARGIPFTQHAAPRTASGEAARAYQDGLAAFSDGRLDQARGHFDQALARDPGFAAAAWRRAVLSQCQFNEGREIFRSALAGRASLDDRDRGLLDAWEPAFLRQPADESEVVRRMQALVQRYPQDAEVWANLGISMVCGNGAPFDVQLRTWNRVLALDPTSGLAWMNRIGARIYLGELDGAHEDCDRCLELAPTATACLFLRIDMQNAVGQCRSVEADARRWLTIEPEAPRAYGALADALFSNGALPDAIRELQAARRARLPDAVRPLQAERDAQALAAATGDFAAAERHGANVLRMVEGTPAEADHADATRRQVAILDEVGRAADAAQLAQAFLSKRAAWEPSPNRDDWSVQEDPTAYLLGIERRAGVLSPAQFIAARDERVAWWEHQAAFIPARHFLWGSQHAAAVATPEEAREAVGALPRFAPLPRYGPMPRAHVDAAVGRALLLAGRVDEARTILERTAAACYGLWFPIEHVRARFDLGQAREARGDTRGACDAYRAVLDRWGGARPSSLTADQARARAAALGCVTSR